jgi:hypothetical protein
METKQIIAELDAEIARLQQVKALLSPTTTRSVGRPKGSTQPAAPKKRQMSHEARERISVAQRKRWAKAKKTAK